MSTWQDLAGILNYLLTDDPSFAASLLTLIGVFILFKQISDLKKELGGVKGRLGNVETELVGVKGRLTNVEGQVAGLQTQFREHELQCGERWGQVQRDLGAIRGSGGTADKPGQD